MSWDGYPSRKWAAQPPELWIGMLLYLLLGALAIWILRVGEGTGVWGMVIGLLPVLPMAMIVRGYLRMVQHQDELHRRIQLEASAIAAVLTLVFCFTAWFLETFSGLPRMSIQWAGIFLFFSYAVATGILTWRYT